MTPIGPISNSTVQGLVSSSQNHKVMGEGGPDFSKQLMDVLKEVNDSQTNASQVQQNFMTGRQNVDYHDLMIAMEKASTALQLTMSVRNKILDAYQEISKTQI